MRDARFETLRFQALGVVAGLLALCLAAGCYVENPLFCCTTQESCARNQGPGMITPCTDPARPYCDDDGEYGPGRTCIPDPVSQSCEGPEECPAERPFCIDRRCVACETSTDCSPAAPVCNETTHACQACTEHGDCVDHPGTPRCHEASGACVACLDDPDCSGATPVCDDNVCRACVAHGECGSGVCDRASGACVDGTNVIYLAPGGQGSGTCTQGAPCNSFALGLAQVVGSRNVIKAAAGTYTGQVNLAGLTVRIFGDGATVQPAPADQTVVVVTNGANATIDGLAISGMTGPLTGVGIRCDAASTLRLSRSQVTGSGGGGVAISGCQFSLVNNVVALNGSATSAIGGIEIGGITTAGTHELQFNTVASNTGSAGINTGVHCGTVTVPLTFSNNIVYGNQVSGGTQVGGSANCAWTYSNIGPQGVTNTGNLNADPQFVDVGNRNFHLRPTSPARDAADPAATLGWDIDGDRRPQGDRHDMGADEVVE